MTDPKQPKQPVATLEFPCDYSIKIVANTVPDLMKQLFDIIHQFDIDVDPDSVKQTASKQQNYISVSLTMLNVQSKDQLEKICVALRAHQPVIMLL